MEVENNEFITAWIKLDRFPGSMMMSSRGGEFGPVPGTTDCLITTSEAVAQGWKQQNKPVIQVQRVSHRKVKLESML